MSVRPVEFSSFDSSPASLPTLHYCPNSRFHCSHCSRPLLEGEIILSLAALRLLHLDCAAQFDSLASFPLHTRIPGFETLAGEDKKIVAAFFTALRSARSNLKQNLKTSPDIFLPPPSSSHFSFTEFSCPKFSHSTNFPVSVDSSMFDFESDDLDFDPPPQAQIRQSGKSKRKFPFQGQGEEESPESAAPLSPVRLRDFREDSVEFESEFEPVKKFRRGSRFQFDDEI